MTKVKIQTTLGDITVRLYDETPLHRDNFLKLAKEGYYNGTLFHRVIKDFMIQGGDPDSKTAKPGQMLGVGGPGYTIPAEFNPSLIHKRGALAAARQGDEVNPEKASSGSQFYIVWGQKYNDSQLAQMDKQMKQQAEQSCFNALVSARKAEIMQLRKERNAPALMKLQDELIKMAKDNAKSVSGLSDTQKEIYKTIGGTPFLDGGYTVFGEVEEGLDIVENIQNTETGSSDRPHEDIKIISAEIL